MSRRAVCALGVALALVTGVAFGGCAAGTNADSALRPSTGAAGEPDETSDEPGKPDAPDDRDSAAGQPGEVEARAGGGGMPPLNTDADNAGTGNVVESCAAELRAAELVPLDLYLMVDASSSMLDPISANSTKWSQVKSALRQFVKDKKSAGLGVGLQFFPLLKPDIPEVCGTDADCGNAGPCSVPGMCWVDSKITGDLYGCLSNAECLYGPCIPQGTCDKNSDYYCPTFGASCGSDALGTCQEAAPHGACSKPVVCEATAYATPAQPIETLPDAADALLASLDAQAPKGTTPTGPALRGALQQATSWAKKHEGHRVVVVLATDGLPTECTPTNIDEVGDLAFDAVTASPSIKTVVIGVLTQADITQGAQTQLDTIAHSGGTEQAILVDTTKDVASQFLAALTSIRTDPLACEFKIPQPSGGKDLDYAQVNVNFKKGKASTSLPYVGSLGDCDSDTGGWYYDADPKVAAPTTIYACPSNCTAFQASNDTSVEIALGCETIVK